MNAQGLCGSVQAGEVKRHRMRRLRGKLGLRLMRQKAALCQASEGQNKKELVGEGQVSVKSYFPEEREGKTKTFMSDRRSLRCPKAN